MSEIPNDSSGDTRAWRLTRAQASRYHFRLARMYADRSVMYAAKAVRLGRVSQGLALVAMVLAAAVILSEVLG